jgi:hypothetical protein
MMGVEMMGALDMLSSNFTIELLEKVGHSVHATVTFGQIFLSEAIWLGLGTAGAVSGPLVTLIHFLITGDAPPAPTPTPPLPF